MNLKRKQIVFVIIAIVLLIVYASTGNLEEKPRHAFLILFMAAAFWITEIIPFAATSFLIAFSQPLLGIQPFSEALRPFFDSTVVLLLGGFLLAIALEKNKLDEWLAHIIVRRLGSNPKTIVLGLMLTTAFLSMWISNTASTALMIAIALKVTTSIKDEKKNFSKVVVLAIAYSATVGGIASLIGTPPNALAAGFLEGMIGYQIGFLEWFMYGLPISLIGTIVIWILLLIIFPVRVRESKLEKEEKLESLGKKQKLTLVVFLFAVAMWLTGRVPDPLVVLTGWSGHGLSPSMVAVLVSLILFLTGLLDEHDLPKVSWNTLLLFGGGLSLGVGLEASGLTGIFANHLLEFAVLSPESTTLLILGFSALILSVVASNTASASIFIPIAITVSLETGTNPVIFAVLVAVCSSLDFMLPIGTPPNAIAHSTGRVKIREMIKAGILLDIIGCLITVVLAMVLWPIFF